MSGLAYLIQHPGSARSHISISTAPQAQPFAIAIRSLQREAIRLDPNWKLGHYDDENYTEAGMSIARKLGVITYLSPMDCVGRFSRNALVRSAQIEIARNQILLRRAQVEPFPNINVMGGYGEEKEIPIIGRFARIRLDSDAREEEPFAVEFQIESYLAGHARRFVRSFDPNSYLYLSRASDWFDISEYAPPGGAAGDVTTVLASIHVEKALVIGVTTDILFPLTQQQQIAEGLEAGGAAVDFVALDSPQGHDSFLVDIPRFGAPIARLLASL